MNFLYPRAGTNGKQSISETEGEKALLFRVLHSWYTLQKQDKVPKSYQQKPYCTSAHSLKINNGIKRRFVTFIAWAANQKSQNTYGERSLGAMRHARASNVRNCAYDRFAPIVSFIRKRKCPLGRSRSEFLFVPIILLGDSAIKYNTHKVVLFSFFSEQRKRKKNAPRLFVELSHGPGHCISIE